MKLIVNSNRLIAALIKDSFSRKILLSSKFEFITVDFGRKEVEKYAAEIARKARINENQFYQVMELLFKRVQLIEEDEIEHKARLKAKNIMEKIDEKDIPFIALALSIENQGIWSDDKHFQQQKAVRIWTTKQLVKFL